MRGPDIGFACQASRSSLAIAQKGDVAAGADAVRRAAAVHPGWLTLLDRLSPEFAPAGEAVRQQLQ